MPTIVDYLAGGFGDTESYEAKDPFVQAARAFGSYQYKPQTSSEAVWMPALQGLLSGGLYGYGKAQARETAYDIARVNPLMQQYSQQVKDKDASFIGPQTEEGKLASLLADYSGENAPEGWTADKVKPQMIQALLTQQTAEEEKVRKAELIKGLQTKGLALNEAGQVVPIPGFAEAEAAAAGLKKKAEITAEGSEAWWKDVPPADKQKLTQAKGVVGQLDKLAQDFENANITAAEFVATQDISGTKANQLKSRMMTLIPNTVRLMGDVGNLAEGEQRRVIDATLGNFTSGTKGAAQRIRNLAEQSQGIVQSKLEGYKLAQTDPSSLLIRDPASKKPITQAQAQAEARRRGLIK